MEEEKDGEWRWRGFFTSMVSKVNEELITQTLRN